MGTVIHYAQRGNAACQQRWERMRRAELLDQYRDLQAQGVSQRHAAKGLAVPRTTLQAWRVWQERLDSCPQVGTFVASGPGLASLHRLVMALPVVCVEIGACGIRLVCLFLQLTGRHRFVGASYGTPPQVNRRVEEAMVAYRQEEHTRLAQEMPTKASTLTQDETLTGGLCLVGREPVRNSSLVEHTAAARDQDTWKALMASVLAQLKGNVIQSTSDEAPGLLAYVEHPLGVQHSPALFHGQHARSKAVTAPRAVKQRAAAQAVAQAEETLKRVHEPLANGAPAQRGPGRPPKAPPGLEQAAQAVALARHEHQRLTGQREQGTQSLRALGPAYHFVDLERGVRRNGTRIAGDIQQHIDTIRPIAHQAGLSETCLERLAKAERVVPTRHATIELVSGDVRQQVRQLDLAQTASYAMHAHLIPSYSLERVASTRTVPQGEPLRALAERLRTPRFEPGGAWSHLPLAEQRQLKAEATKLADVFQRSSAKVEGRNGYLSLRNHQLRGLDRPRKRECLTAVHNFLLTRPDGTTAAERFFGQKPRSMFATRLGAVDIPPAPLSPPRRAVA